MSAHTPAFPCEWDYIGTNRADANGMTLRDYFAAKAMQAILSVLENGIRPSDIDTMARDTYSIADAMLRARSGE